MRTLTLPALVCALLLLSGCATLERHHDALTLVTALADSRSPAAEPAHREISYRSGDHRYRADFYPASGTARANLVLVHGFTREGKNDPRLQHFARNLAQVHFNVLVPQLDSLRRFEVSRENVAGIAAAIAHLETQPELAKGGIGIGGISYAVGPTILAALEQEADFIIGVGGYYDLVDAITFATTGYYQAEGEWRYRKPAPGGKWLILLGHAHQLPGEDGALLTRIAQTRLDDPSADVTDLSARLSAAGRAVYQLVTNQAPQQVPQLIQRLPQKLQRQIAALDLSRRDLSGLSSQLILIHGTEDPLIPATHSEALAEAVPPDQAELYLVEGLMHVDVTPGFAGALDLYRAALAIMRARDGIY